MKDADLAASDVTVPAGKNGLQRSRKKNGAAVTRSAGNGAAAQTESATQPFVAAEPGPIDLPMWPLHAALWFQPELAPSGPGWSGLTVERQGRIPAPDFVHSGLAPLDYPYSLDHSRHELTPGARPEIPQSDGAPVGWDPRAAGRREGHE
jgi:hypothetical protein